MNNSKITMDHLKDNVADVCAFFKSAEGQSILDKLIAGCPREEFVAIIKEHAEKMTPYDREFIEKTILPCFVEKQEERPEDAETEPETKKDRKVLKGILWGVGLVAAAAAGVLAAKWLGKENVAAAATTATDAAQTAA